MTKDFEIPSFIAKIWQQGDSSVITLDAKVKKFVGLENGDYVKVMIKKIEKPEE